MLTIPQIEKAEPIVDPVPPVAVPVTTVEAIEPVEAPLGEPEAVTEDVPVVDIPAEPVFSSPKAEAASPAAVEVKPEAEAPKEMFVQFFVVFQYADNRQRICPCSDDRDHRRR